MKPCFRSSFLCPAPALACRVHGKDEWLSSFYSHFPCLPEQGHFYRCEPVSPCTLKNTDHTCYVVKDLDLLLFVCSWFCFSLLFIVFSWMLRSLKGVVFGTQNLNLLFMFTLMFRDHICFYNFMCHRELYNSRISVSSSLLISLCILTADISLRCLMETSGFLPKACSCCNPPPSSWKKCISSTHLGTTQGDCALFCLLYLIHYKLYIYSFRIHYNLFTCQLLSAPNPLLQCNLPNSHLPNLFPCFSII